VRGQASGVGSRSFSRGESGCTCRGGGASVVGSRFSVRRRPAWAGGSRSNGGGRPPTR
jgi:hypothetical protein